MGTSSGLLLASRRCYCCWCSDRFHRGNISRCLCWSSARSGLLLVLYRSQHDKRLLGRLSIAQRIRTAVVADRPVSPRIL
jgi:hypothetical protein